MGLKFGSEREFDRWRAEAERKVRDEETAVMAAPTFKPHHGKRSDMPGYAMKAKPASSSRRRRLARRAVKHVTRPGHRRRAGSALHTLLAPFR